MKIQKEWKKPDWEIEFDKKFSHSKACDTQRFEDFQKERFIDCYCQLKEIKQFINSL